MHRKNANSRVYQMWCFLHHHLLKMLDKRNNANGLVMKSSPCVIPVDKV